MNTNHLENQFNKALLLLDFGKTEKAIDILNDIINQSHKENKLFFIRASCILGELSFSMGKMEDANKHLLNVMNTPYKDDTLDYEKSIASDILSKI